MRVPHDHEAERAALGCAMLSAKALDTVLTQLSPDDFHEPRNRQAFVAMRELAAESQTVDEVTVGGRLSFDGVVSYVGGMVADAPLSGAVVSYVRVLRDRAVRRAIIRAAQHAIDEATGSEDAPQSVADRASSAMASAVATQSDEIAPATRVLLDREFKRMEKARNGEIPLGLETGFYDLDSRLGGLQPGSLNIVAGRPAMGKTALATAIAQHAAAHGARVLLFSLEMSASEVAQRLFASVSRLNLNHIRTGQLASTAWPRLAAVCDRYHNTHFGVSAVADLTILQLRANARRWRAQNGGIDLVVVDYLQLMGGDDSRDNREREVAKISRGLKALAMELRIPIIALSQLSRKCEERANKRPMLSDLRESGAVEQDADAVMFVYRDEYYYPDSKDRGLTEVIVAKNRNGQSGAEPIMLRWTPESTRFDNLQQESA